MFEFPAIFSKAFSNTSGAIVTTAANSSTMQLEKKSYTNCNFSQDENCFKIHWSSVLLSLVSYILLAITLLLCLSCFARVLIQWSVRSSLAELRTVGSPTGSFRGSSRFFSFLGTTFTGRWERPPPTYDEALKHINPDLARPTAPPPYTDNSGNGSERNEQFDSRQHGIVETPPPEYDSHHDIGLQRVLSSSSSGAVMMSSSEAEPDHHHALYSQRRSHHRKHRHRSSKNKLVTTAADVLATSVSAEALMMTTPTSSSSMLINREAAEETLTLTSVEINEEVRHSPDPNSEVSPSRFSSNSINTVILNPGAMALSSSSSPMKIQHLEPAASASSASPIRT